MHIEIICTGDEVLTGKTINTNFSHISQKLEDVGLAVRWGTTVGDDRETLLQAFHAAGERADAVIVNGGLGPTIDDLSQEVAAQAAGVELVLHEGWLARMEERFRQRGRFMSPNNRKQAFLPAGAELIDNAIGTACGFAVDIGKARFYFTPGVPRELYRMLEEQVLPRLLARSGQQTAIYLKRFHSYGLGNPTSTKSSKASKNSPLMAVSNSAFARIIPNWKLSSPCAARIATTFRSSWRPWSRRYASVWGILSSPKTIKRWQGLCWHSSPPVKVPSR